MTSRSQLGGTLYVVATPANPSQLHVLDPVCEREWLPHLGPSCWVLLRHLALTLDEKRGVYDVDELGRAIGLRPPRLTAAVDRLVHYHAAGWDGPALSVRFRLPAKADGAHRRRGATKTLQVAL